jgi:acetolactate decarboxylase
VSTIDQLSKGNYKGIYALKGLHQYGDFGLGTFDGLDGEMVVLDGQFYQITSDGKVQLAHDEMKTPFIALTYFDVTDKFAVDVAMDEAAFAKYLESHLPDSNLFYAVRVKGTFAALTVRSVPKQQEPYPLLSEVIKNRQKVFNLGQAQGTMVGFWCPASAAGMNVAGGHFHFLTDDRKVGGHVLKFTTDHVIVEIDEIKEFHALLGPRS